MHGASLSRRLESLPTARLGGLRPRVAVGPRARLLGLAFLDAGEVGDGLVTPRCASVHTFGMRFPLDLVFLGRRGGEEDRPTVVGVRSGVPPRRLVWCRGAVAVLELPARPSQGAGSSAVGGGRVELFPG